KVTRCIPPAEARRIRLFKHQFLICTIRHAHGGLFRREKRAIAPTLMLTSELFATRSPVKVGMALRSSSMKQILLHAIGYARNWKDFSRACAGVLMSRF